MFQIVHRPIIGDVKMQIMMGCSTLLTNVLHILEAKIFRNVLNLFADEKIDGKSEAIV